MRNGESKSIKEVNQAHAETARAMLEQAIQKALMGNGGIESVTIKLPVNGAKLGRPKCQIEFGRL